MERTEVNSNQGMLSSRRSKKRRQEEKRAPPDIVSYMILFFLASELPSLVTCRHFFSLSSGPVYGMTSVHTSSHVARAQPCESVRTVPPTAGKALEVSALVAYVPGSVTINSGCLLLCERVHVSTDRHRGAALRRLHLCLLGCCRLDARRYAVFGEGLQWSLWCELGVVVEGEDGGFV